MGNGCELFQPNSQYLFESGHKMAADGARSELLVMIQKGRDVLSRLESIAFIDLLLIHVEDFPNFWIETLRLVEGLQKRVAYAGAVLQICLDIQACA
jgi:hypothetical protein